MLPKDEEYNQQYSEKESLFSFFRPPSLGVASSPVLAELFWPGQNYSGMEETPRTEIVGRVGNMLGSWRLANANGDVLEAEVDDLLNYGTYADAVDAGGRSAYILKGFGGDEEKLEEKFNKIKENLEEAKVFTDLTMAGMNNIHAFVPRVLDDNGEDTLECWSVLRLHEIDRHEDHPGFFGIPNTLDNGNFLKDGFLCLHNKYYPGAKHASGKKNGRAIPPVVYVSQVEGGEKNWQPNISCEAASWLDEAYDDFEPNELENGQVLWDYVLAISSASKVQEVILDSIGYLLNIPFPQTYETFQQVSELGRVMRLLQMPSSLSDTDRYYQLQESVRAFYSTHMKLEDKDGVNLEPGVFEIHSMKRLNSLHSEILDKEEIELELIGQAEFEALCQASEIDADKLIEILGRPQRVCIDGKNKTQWIKGIPENVIKFRLGDELILKKWIAIHSNLDDGDSLMHAIWTDEIRMKWWREIEMVIRNITILLLLRPKINDFAKIVIDDLLPWINEEE